MGKWADGAARRSQELRRAAGGGLPAGSTGGTFETVTGRGMGANRPLQVFDPANPASFGTSAKAGLADDINTKIRVFAKARFPNLPLEEAVQRYGVVDGDIVYRNEGGQVVKEIGGLLSNVGSAVGAIGPTAAGATIGTMLGGPGGGAAALSAGLLGAGGEAGRKIAANTLLDEPQTSLGNAADIAAAGVVEGLSTRAGSLLFDKVTQPRVARDISRMDDAMVRRGADRSAIAARESLPITPAEATGLPSLRRDQIRMTQDQGPAGDIMGEFLESREAGPIPNVMESLLGAAKRPGESVGAAAKGAAEQVIQSARDVRKLAADPLYTAARGAGDVIDSTGAIQFLDGQLEFAKGPVKAALKRARKLLLTERKVPATPARAAHTVMEPDTTVSGLHGAKIALDEMIDGTGTNSVGNTTRGLLKRLREEHLLPALDASDLYRQAREVYRRASPPVDALQNSLVGRIAKLGDDKLSTFGNQVFDRNVTPTQMRAARRAFMSSDEPGIWDEMVATHLRQIWEEMRDVGSSNSAALLVNKISSSPRRRAVLKEALGPEASKRWLEVLEVFDGYRSGGQSITHFAGVAERKMQERAVAANPILNAGDTALGVLRPGAWQSMLREMTGDRYLENMAKVVTSPDAMSRLKELRRLPPKSKKARELVALGLGMAGFETVSDWLGAEPPDRPPE